MRLGGYVLLELGATLAAAAALGLGGREAARAVIGVAVGSEVLHRPRPAAPARVEAVPDLGAPPAPPVAETPAGTFLGVSDELLLAPLRERAITRVKFNHGGTSVSLRLDLEGGFRCAFKPRQVNLQSDPRKEVAAYLLNRALGLNAVPPATWRVVRRDELVARLDPESRPLLPRILKEVLWDAEGRVAGEASFWIPVIKDSGIDHGDGRDAWASWLRVDGPLPADKKRFAAQISEMLAFDLLANNYDRFSGGNALMSPDGVRLYFMDNTIGFQADPDGHARVRAALAQCERFSRRLYAALALLDRATVLRAVRGVEPGIATPLLRDGEVDALLARRDRVLEHIDGLVERHGWGRVMVFP